MDQLPTILQLYEGSEYTNILLDVETSTGVGHKAGPSPHLSSNRLVAIGMWAEHYMEEYNKEGLKAHPMDKGLGRLDKPCVIIGHNIKFDIVWLLKKGYITKKQLQHCYLIDTSILEYKLSHHQHTWPSLKDCCIKRKLPTKTDRVGCFWKAGIETHMIPKSILMEYLKNDVMVTKELVAHQMFGVFALTEKQQRLLTIEMEALKAACIIESEGMPIDLATFSYHEHGLAKLVQGLDNDLVRYAQLRITDGIVRRTAPKGLCELGLEVDSISSIHAVNNSIMNYMLYSVDFLLPCTSLTVDEDGNNIRYKSGKKAGELKTKKSKVWFSKVSDVELNTIACLPDSPQSATTIEKHGSNSAFKAAMLDKIKYSKEHSTYFEGLSHYIHGNKLHGNFNFTATATSRLSSSKPNLQNLSGKDQ